MHQSRAVDVARRWSFGCLCGCLLIVNATFTLLSPIFPQVRMLKNYLIDHQSLMFYIVPYGSTPSERYGDTPLLFILGGSCLHMQLSKHGLCRKLKGVMSVQVW